MTTMNDDPAFYWMDLDHTHVADMTRSMANTLSPLHVRGYDPYPETALYGIVSEEDGGIIAYAIGIEHANLVVDALKAGAR